MSTKTCPACGAEIVYSGRGRPRRYCETCTPPGSSTGAWMDAWLNEHHDEIEAERHRRHEEWMAESGAKMKQHREQMAENARAAKRKANIRQRKETIAENRRKLESKSRKAAA